MAILIWIGIFLQGLTYFILILRYFPVWISVSYAEIGDFLAGMSHVHVNLGGNPAEIKVIPAKTALNPAEIKGIPAKKALIPVKITFIPAFLHKYPNIS
ncbi:hypothetical protein HP456_23810 [Bacillus haikouensis]|uniref:hypothetical protein n=1 Tax=Bacillus haikouensis TaxID=1510468 RepID=UPI00155647F6|nr:hypothetical protein [Bacillus haikouensis]NQD68935.1 hypothetical protein [Bacillus haikouensis]